MCMGLFMGSLFCVILLCLFFPQHHTVRNVKGTQVTITFYWVLKSLNMSPPTIFSFFKIVLAILVPSLCHINFWQNHSTVTLQLWENLTLPLLPERACTSDLLTVIFTDQIGVDEIPWDFRDHWERGQPFSLLLNLNTGSTLRLELM